MNMIKLKNFTKKYGFYLAVGFISVGAITAVIVTSNNKGDATNKPNPYAQSEETMGRSIDEVDPMDSVPVDSIYDDKDMIAPEDKPQQATTPVQNDKKEQQEQQEQQEQAKAKDEVTTETFNSTTVDSQEAPFFAEGDTLLLPVKGKLVVPYTDDTTKHWYSEALEQTMRTYGITVSAKQGESIKAPATAKIVDVIADATALEPTKYVGDVGQVIVMDLGNGYTCQIGVEGGKVSKELVGQVVLAGQEIGVAGAGTGPFAGAEGSVYVQLQHEGQSIDPTEMFAFNE